MTPDAGSAGIRPGLTCDDVRELVGLYVLDALEPAERAAVGAHLNECTQAHEEIRELGGVVPALASLAEPVDAPPALKARVLAAVQREATGSADARSGAAVRPWTLAEPARISEGARRGWRAPGWLSWGAAAAAVIVLAVVGVWALDVQSRAQFAAQRSAVLADAIAAFSAPDSAVAVIRGGGAAAGASGFAAFPEAGGGYIVLVGLPAAPPGQTYQAWYLVDGQASSAGLMSVDLDGYALLHGIQPLPGTDLVAFTIERASGADQPTMDPIAVGEVRPPA